MKTKSAIKTIATGLTLVATLMTSSAFAGQTRSPVIAPVVAPVIVYAALGEELSRYELDVGDATLTKLGSLKFPANVQFAEFHPCQCFLYVVSSNAGSGTSGAAGDRHALSALRIDARTGALQAHGESIALPERPIHVTVDKKGENVLVAFNQSGTVKVYRLSRDGYLGEEVAQKEKPDGGIFTHQVVVTPANKTVIALGRGNEAVDNKPADIGSVSTFSLHDGQINLIRKENFEEGIGPRHLAFHPARPWVYVGIERGSKLFF
jgi:6-phosphogluconolactonase (cycloisomerase 2 family)